MKKSQWILVAIAIAVGSAWLIFLNTSDLVEERLKDYEEIPVETGQPVEKADGADDADQTDPDLKDFSVIQEQKGIIFTAVFLTPEITQPEQKVHFKDHLLIHFSMDTHEGDLNQLNIKQLTSLLVEDKIIKPVEWIDVNNDGHHRSGVIVFPKLDDQGNPLISEEKQTVVLSLAESPLLQNMDFTWNLPLSPDERK
ncbi:hypothetical protein L1765_14500 [Microaerobacter geothermalis]|uniref:hypothetical protein n=1 Tax=Microaerobacter geothermalis TaxID=674972 RepID=UPI001F2F436B|nr:hypothetical protein [Microaerobacter geothermalis]MCF6095171.1 hypothetical protein [Microaerobacter geothermalis]